jgi:hypothetical protein
VIYSVGVTSSLPFVPWKPDPIRAYFVRLALSNLMKTKIIQYLTTNDEYKWYLDGKEITTKEDAIHLGIIRSEKNECNKNIEARLESARPDPPVGI